MSLDNDVLDSTCQTGSTLSKSGRRAQALTGPHRLVFTPNPSNERTKNLDRLARDDISRQSFGLGEGTGNGAWRMPA